MLHIGQDWLSKLLANVLGDYHAVCLLGMDILDDVDHSVIDAFWGHPQPAGWPRTIQQFRGHGPEMNQQLWIPPLSISNSGLCPGNETCGSGLSGSYNLGEGDANYSKFTNDELVKDVLHASTAANAKMMEHFLYVQGPELQALTTTTTNGGWLGPSVSTGAPTEQIHLAGSGLALCFFGMTIVTKAGKQLGF